VIRPTFLNVEYVGVLGLGFNTDSISHPPSFMEQLNGSFFSICLGLDNGYLRIEENNEIHLEPKPLFIPFHPEGGYYRINLAKIEDENGSLDVDEKALNHGLGAFFDSGTTLTYFNFKIYQAIMQSFQDFCQNPMKCGGKNNKVVDCFKYDQHLFAQQNSFFDSFPQFTFYFGEGEKIYSYQVQGHDYLYKLAKTDYLFCLGFV